MAALLFAVVWKEAHLSRKHPLVLLLFEQVRRVAHVVTVHKVVCVVHADWVHGKPAEEESEDTHGKCTVESIYWKLTYGTFLWDHTKRDYWYLGMD